MEILRLRCAPFLGSCGAVRLTQTRVRFACKSRSPKAKRLFLPSPSSRPSAHRARVERSRALLFAQAWRSFGCAALRFWAHAALCASRKRVCDLLANRVRPKRNACFCPHRHLDQAHTVRAWRDLVHCFCPGMEILRLRRLTGGFTQDDGKGAALLTALFLGKALQKALCSPHPSLRDTFPPRGRNGMKDCCACPPPFDLPRGEGTG